MKEAVARLQRFRDHCAAGILPLPEDSDWMVFAIDALATGSARDLNDALGLKAGPGQPSIGRRLQLQRRNALLQDCAARFHADQLVGRQAVDVAKKSSSYETDCWPRDRNQVEIPAGLRGTEQEIYFKILRSGQSIPRYRQLIEILSQDQKCSRLPVLAASDTGYINDGDAGELRNARRSGSVGGR